LHLRFSCHKFNTFLKIHAPGFRLEPIKRELKHSEAIAYKILAELCSLLALMLRFGRKVKEYKHPHNPIFTDATVHRITQMLKDG